MQAPQRDFVDELSSERHSPVAVYQEFRIRYGEISTAVHCFFEGQDDKQFFLGYVRSRFKSMGVFPYVCNGKRGVVEVREKVKRDRRVTNVYFFVDKDIDDFFSEQVDVDDKTFMTRYYSFENYIVSEDVLAAILDDFTHLPKGGRRQVEILRNYRQLYAQFCRKMLAFMSVAAACREANVRPTLGNLKLDKIFNLRSEQDMQILPDWKEHFRKSIGADGASLTSSSIIVWSKAFRGSGEKEWLRGKWELWFFAEFLKRVFEKLEHETRGRGRRVRMPVSVKEGAVLEIAATRCPEPSELAEFFDGG